jgi:hypothetical protein
MIMNNVMGGEPTELNIAIVNHDSSYQNCINSSSWTVKVTKDSCYLNHISCRLINEIDGQVFKKFFYKSSEEAIKETSKLKTAMILTFDRNFTAAVNFINQFPEDFDEVERSFFDSSHIQVQLDFTDMRLSHFIKQKIFSAYKSFSEKMMESCGLSKALKKLPMSINLVHDVNSKEFQLPGFLIMYGFPSCLHENIKQFPFQCHFHLSLQFHRFCEFLRPQGRLLESISACWSSDS